MKVHLNSPEILVSEIYIELITRILVANSSFDWDSDEHDDLREKLDRDLMIVIFNNKKI